MRHYFSIANFLIGGGTKIYDSIMHSHNHNQKTYQQLFGEMVVWSEGKNREVYNLCNNNYIPIQFINSWSMELAQKIVNEYIHIIAEMEYSQNWNGDAHNVTIQHTYIWNLANDWSTTITIVAGVLDVINDNFTTITNVATEAFDAINFTLTFLQQNNNEDNMNNFKNTETLLNKYGYKYYSNNAELFLTHLTQKLKKRR